MSCEYCKIADKPVPLIYAGPKYGCLYIDGCCLMLEVNKGGLRPKKHRQVFPVLFCPMCGCRLKAGDTR